MDRIMDQLVGGEIPSFHGEIPEVPPFGRCVGGTSLSHPAMPQLFVHS